MENVLKNLPSKENILAELKQIKTEQEKIKNKIEKMKANLDKLNFREEILNKDLIILQLSEKQNNPHNN